MKTVSLKLPDALATWLEKQAATERRSKSHIVGGILRQKRSEWIRLAHREIPADCSCGAT